MYEAMQPAKLRSINQTMHCSRFFQIKHAAELLVHKHVLSRRATAGSLAATQVTPCMARSASLADKALAGEGGAGAHRSESTRPYR